MPDRPRLLARAMALRRLVPTGRRYSKMPVRAAQFRPPFEGWPPERWRPSPHWRLASWVAPPIRRIASFRAGKTRAHHPGRADLFGTISHILVSPGGVLLRDFWWGLGRCDGWRSTGGTIRRSLRLEAQFRPPFEFWRTDRWSTLTHWRLGSWVPLPPGVWLRFRPKRRRRANPGAPIGAERASLAAFAFPDIYYASASSGASRALRLLAQNARNYPGAPAPIVVISTALRRMVARSLESIAASATRVLGCDTDHAYACLSARGKAWRQPGCAD